MREKHGSKKALRNQSSGFSMKIKPMTSCRGFTLVEILVVIAIISLMAAILVPVADKALKGAYKRRALVEMNAIKMAVLEFHREHKYMPWPGAVKVGNDAWTTSESEHKSVMELLTGENPMRKAYLQIPEKSRPADKSLVFRDPWGQYYRIGMDRNLDGAVTVTGTGEASWDGKIVMEKVLVYPMGDPETDPKRKLKTFDVPVQ